MTSELNEEEIMHIEAFCSNEKMYEAVRKGILSGLYSHGVLKAGHKHDPLQNGALSLAAISTNNPIPDEVLGQHIRGVWAGLNALENGFNGLLKIKSSKGDEKPETVNEAV